MLGPQKIVSIRRRGKPDVPASARALTLVNRLAEFPCEAAPDSEALKALREFVLAARKIVA